MNVPELDKVVTEALTALAQELRDSRWNVRREREIVSHFCFRHLVGRCRNGAVLHDPAQIGIEVAVPQVANQEGLSGRAGSKSQVCKDIVIWPDAKMTCWDEHGKPTQRPMCIIEWKHNDESFAERDIKWLVRFSENSRAFVGYAVRTQLPADINLVSCTRVFNGEAGPLRIGE